MRRIEAVSLFFLLAAAAVLTITLQMEYGSARKWMFFLFLALLLPAMNPKFYKNRTRRQEHVFTPIEREETEEDEMGFIDLSSAEPIKQDLQIVPDTYLTFRDIASGNYYYVHYVDGEADEIYVSDFGDLERLKYDEFYEIYQTVDELIYSAKKEASDELYSISADDFNSVRKRYQDRMAEQSQVYVPAQTPQEPVNRVGRIIAYIFGIVSFGFVAVGGLILPFVKELGVGSTILCWFFSGSIIIIAVMSVIKNELY